MTSTLLREVLHVGTGLELVQYTGPIVERFGPVLARREGVHSGLITELCEVRGATR